MNSLPASAPRSLPRHGTPRDKLPGHWLLASMGKRVLRPGGIELTRQLLIDLAIGERDDVVEFAPGLGVTARMTLARRPRSYTAIERDREAAATVETYLTGPHQQCIVGTAEQTGLPSGLGQRRVRRSDAFHAAGRCQVADRRRGRAPAEARRALRHP